MEAKFIIQMEKSKTTITNLKASSDLVLLQFHGPYACYTVGVMWIKERNMPATSIPLFLQFS